MENVVAASVLMKIAVMEINVVVARVVVKVMMDVNVRVFVLSV